METRSEQGQSLVEMVILLSAIVLFVFASMPKLLDQFAKETKEISLTKEVRR